MSVIALAGYFLFRWSKGSSAAWKYIPSNAIVVITSEHLQDSLYEATEAGVDVKRLPLLDIASDNLSLLNLLTPDAKKLSVFLKGKTISYSYHPRTGTEWGILMYIPIANEDESKWLFNPQHGNIRVLQHTFQNQRITDINDTSSRPLFSYLVKDDYLIVSYFGDLIEDVVRSSSISIQSFKLKSQFAKSHDSNYGTSIYLKSEAWKSVVSSGNNTATFREFAKNFPELQDFHIDAAQDPRKLSIQSGGGESPGYYLTELLKDNQGSPFTSHKHISQQTSYFYRFAASDKDAFKKKFLNWHEKNKSEAWEKINYHIGKESSLLTENFGSELILCQLEENNSINDGKILLAEFSNYDKLRPVLLKLAKLSTSESNVSVDKYQGYDIYSVPIPELPAGLYGPMFTGFSVSYITYVAPYLVISNNSQVLQNYITDYENHITWKQSPEYDSILTKEKTDAQLSLVVNLRKAQSRGGNQGGKNYTDITSKIESIVFRCHYYGNEASPEILLYPKKKTNCKKSTQPHFPQYGY